MGRSCFVRLTLLLGLGGMLPSTELRAAVFVPMTVEDLTEGSVAVVTGTVGRLTGVELADGRIYTLVDVAVDQVLKGALPTGVITLKEDGGAVGVRREVLFGMPQFERGERVLLFLTVRQDGSLQTYQFALGKFHLELDVSGMPLAVQQFGQAPLMVVPPGAQIPGTRAPLGALLKTVEGMATAGPAVAGGTALRTRPPEADEPSLRREATNAFTLLGNGRFFEADEGMPLSFLIDERGDAILGLTTARQAVDNAFAAWTNVATASIVLEDAGLTADLSTPCSPPHKVRFDDPDDEIPDPVNCSGTLGVGGLCSDSSESKVFNGTTFDRGTRARLTLANGWEGCAVWNPCNIAEVATHEIGHAIALGHSSEDPAESDPVLLDATMYFLAHFDGRCANVRADDIDGVSFLYPTEAPPTITTASPLASGVLRQPYSTTLTAIGGTGSFTWTLVRGEFPGLNLSPDGVLSGTPVAIGTTSLQIKVSDDKGDSHMKRFAITVSQSGGQATPTAVPTATPTVPPMRLPCSGDCNDNGAVTVDELVRGVNIALGNLSLDSCLPFDSNNDTAVTVDELVRAVNAALSGCPS
ncbi:MAG: putative Ig domain-containing protein [Candidatus Binatia bacterium]